MKAFIVVTLAVLCSGCGLLRNQDGTQAYKPAGRSFMLELSGLGCAFKFGSTMTAQPCDTKTEVKTCPMCGKDCAK